MSHTYGYASPGTAHGSVGYVKKGDWTNEPLYPSVHKLVRKGHLRLYYGPDSALAYAYSYDTCLYVYHGGIDARAIYNITDYSVTTARHQSALWRVTGYPEHYCEASDMPVGCSAGDLIIRVWQVAAGIEVVK